MDRGRTRKGGRGDGTKREPPTVWAVIRTAGETAGRLSGSSVMDEWIRCRCRRPSPSHSSLLLHSMLILTTHAPGPRARTSSTLSMKGLMALKNAWKYHGASMITNWPSRCAAARVGAARPPACMRACISRGWCVEALCRGPVSRPCIKALRRGPVSRPCVEALCRGPVSSPVRPLLSLGIAATADCLPLLL